MEGFYPYPDNHGYLISKEGEVYSLYWKKIVTGFVTDAGYLRLEYKHNGKKIRVPVHRMVARTFLGESDLSVNHINGIKTDNRVYNLEYVTSRENSCHKIKKAIGSSKRKGRKTFRSQIVLDGKEIHIGTYDTEEEAQAAYRNVARFMGVHNRYQMGGK